MYSYNNRGSCTSLQVGRIPSITVSTPFQVSTEYNVGARLGVSRTPPCWGGSEENPSSRSSSPWGSIMGISGGQWGIQPGVLTGVRTMGSEDQKGGVQSGWYLGIMLLFHLGYDRGFILGIHLEHPKNNTLPPLQPLASAIERGAVSREDAGQQCTVAGPLVVVCGGGGGVASVALPFAGLLPRFTFL